MGGGAWPFLVGGAICLVNSDNERDSGLLVSASAHGGRQLTSPRLRSAVSVAGHSPTRTFGFLEGRAVASRTRRSDNRSVMPLDVRGRTRATLGESMRTYSRPEGRRESR